MILQLNPPIPITCPKGTALAHFLIDYGIESNLLWVCFVDETGECWTYPNSEIRAQKNISYGRTLDKNRLSCGCTDYGYCVEHFKKFL